MILYFRVEANETTAMGHMTRCVSIADGAKRQGIESVFIVADKNSARLPESKGYKVIILDRQWDDFDGEIPVIERLIENNRIEYLLIDSYWVTEKYMAAVNRITRTAYIDDLHERIWPCTTLINYAVYCDLFDYKNEYFGKQLLLGTRYFPLRSEYVDVPKRQVREQVKEVLLVSGGSDELSFMKRMAERLVSSDKCQDIHFTLILGPFNRDYNEISEIAEKASNITVYKSLPTLKEAMLAADIIISAGGTTLYEMAACSLPGVIYILADNQRYNAEGFGRNGLALYSGDIRFEGTLEKILDNLFTLIEDKALREEMSEKLFKLLDGKGADRIAEEICSYQ